MDIRIGYMYFLSGSFYKKVNDPKLNNDFKGDTRPVYVISKNNDTGLYWVAPCSKQWEKYIKIISIKQNEQKPTEGIQPRKIFGTNSVILLQDMFPVSKKYIKEAYIVRDKHVHSSLSANFFDFFLTKLNVLIKFTYAGTNCVQICRLRYALFWSSCSTPRYRLVIS